MAQTPRATYADTVRYLGTAVDRGEVRADDAEAIRELCAAYDAEDTTASLPTDLYDDRRDPHKAPKTLSAWAERLTVAAKGLWLTDPDIDADAVNAWATGRVKADDGPGQSRVADIENALKKFYRFHPELGVDPGDIIVHDRKTATWSGRDLLDGEERRALRVVAEHPRDLAIYHLLLYCGMRNSALRTMRVGDVDLDAAEWYFNAEADGLKNIERIEEPRPLAQAFRAVREWLDFHPTGDAEDYLITAKPGASKMDPTTPVTKETIRYTMAQLKEKTAAREDVVTVERPCHPHFMRHNFTSMCLKHPEIDDADIKFWLGHAPGSNVMETTYGHLTGDDHNRAGHDAFGIPAVRGAGPDVDPWDEVCETCLRVLSPGEGTCPECQTARGATPWTAEGSDVAALSDRKLAMLDTFLDRLAAEGGDGHIHFSDGAPDVMWTDDPRFEDSRE